MGRRRWGIKVKSDIGKWENDKMSWKIEWNAMKVAMGTGRG